MRKTLIATAAAVGLVLVAGNAGLAAEAPEEPQTETPSPDAQELFEEGMDKILEALEVMYDKIPRYDWPDVNEYGDIIIRRLNPDLPRDDEPSEAAPADPDNPAEPI